MATSLSTNALTDLVTVRVDSHMFTVLKAHLIDKSEVFLVALQPGFKEAFSGSITIHDHAPGHILRLLHFCEFAVYLITPRSDFYKHRPKQAPLLLDSSILSPPFCDRERSVKPEHAVVIHAMMLNLGDVFQMPLLEQYASDRFFDTFRDPSIFCLSPIWLNDYEFWVVLALLQDETFRMAEDIEWAVGNQLVEYANFSRRSEAHYMADHRWRNFLVRIGRLPVPRPLHNAAPVMIENITIKGEDRHESKDEEVLTIKTADCIKAHHEANCTGSEYVFCLAQDDDSLGLADDEAENNMEEDDDNQHGPAREDAFHFQPRLTCELSLTGEASGRISSEHAACRMSVGSLGMASALDCESPVPPPAIRKQGSKPKKHETPHSSYMKETQLVPAKPPSRLPSHRIRQVFPFLDLSGEIRNKIYPYFATISMSESDSQSPDPQYHHPCTPAALNTHRNWSAVVANPAPVKGKCSGYHDKGCPAIFLSSKRVFCEAISFFWEKKEGGFRFCSALCYAKFINAISTGAAKHMLLEAGSIRIDYDGRLKSDALRRDANNELYLDLLYEPVVLRGADMLANKLGVCLHGRDVVVKATSKKEIRYNIRAWGRSSEWTFSCILTWPESGGGSVGLIKYVD